MYHDEFEARSVRVREDATGALPGLAIEVGGGASAAAMSAILLPEMPILLSLGGLFPLLACCLGILAGRCLEARAALLVRLDAWGLGRPERPAPAIGGRPIMALRGPRSALARPRAARAGFDRSRRLG